MHLPKSTLIGKIRLHKLRARFLVSKYFHFRPHIEHSELPNRHHIIKKVDAVVLSHMLRQMGIPRIERQSDIPHGARVLHDVVLRIGSIWKLSAGF